MIQVITNSKTNSYQILQDNKLVVNCKNPLVSFNELLKELGFDLMNVQIYDENSKPFEQEFEQEQEIDFDAVNGTIRFESKNKSIYDKLLSDDSNYSKTTETLEQEEIKDTETTNKPIGNVSKPKVGDIIYVETVNGNLRSIFGGVGIVSFIKEISSDVVEYDEEFDEEIENESITDYLVEIESIPNFHFSWNYLRGKQEELENTFGYKPALGI